MDTALRHDGLEVRHRRDLPARAGRFAEWPIWLPAVSPVRTAVERQGIDSLWTHQAEAAEALRAGRHVVLTTGTASGKSLAYLLPIATAATSPPATDDPVRWRRRPTTSLYLAPTKALAHDQARVCAELAVPGWRVATVDGDTDPADRQWARDHAHHVLTNPDLLHASLLPQHARWASFLRSLRYVVVDESHRYRGVFGAHVAAVLRRLRRLAAHYGAHPALAVVSATATAPVDAAAALTGIDPDGLTLVTDDGSARGRIRIELAASDHAPEQAAAEVMAERIRAGEQVLTFVPSRRLAEEVAASAGNAVAYRGGYLASDRRVIERGLSDGTIRGVAATNALELGVDIAGLDTVVMCGYPGSRAAFWQQAGRAGRRGTDAEVLLIARPSPVDAYLLDHPTALFDQPVEATVLDPASPAVLGPQLAAAAQELPLRDGDDSWFGGTTWALVARLTERGLLRRRPDGWFWTSSQRAVDKISLRSTDARSLDIVVEATGRVLGTVGAESADQVVHPGAVYLHQGETYLCDDTPLGDDGTRSDEGADPASDEVLVRAARPGYLTQPVVEADVSPGPPEAQRPQGAGWMAYGRARVSSTVTGYLRRDEVTGKVWDSTPLACPERVLATSAAVLTVPTPDTGLSRPRLDAGTHALEHLLTGLLPALTANDRYDVGAHSWLDDDEAVIALFDRRPGSGFAATAYARGDAWLAAARDRLELCGCATGCPACILAPGCTSRRPLDKETARRLLATLAPAAFD